MTKPVTNAEMIRSLLKAVNGHRTAKPSVRLWTARGETNVEVLAYGRTATEAGTAAQREYERLNEHFRLPEGFPAPPDDEDLPF